MYKKIKLFTALIAVLVITTSLLPGPSKCSGDDEYVEGLKKITDFRLIKDYRITMKSGSANNPPTLSFPISLTAGLIYKFVPVNNPDNTKKMIMSMYMAENKTMLLASTFSSGSKKHYPTVEFECGRTGTYYLFFSFEEGEKGCGVGMFAVSK